MRASEQRYRRLFESAKDGILILDAETGMVVDVNPFLIELLGVSRETFLSKRVWELGFLKDIAANEEKFAELRAQEYVRYEDLPLESADGRAIAVEFVSNVYLVDGHRVVQCNIREITERKRADEALRQVSARHEAILSEIPDIVVEVDQDMVYTWANPVALEFFGDNIIGKKATDYFVGEQDTHERVQPLFAGDSATFYLESWQRRKDGQRRLLAWWCRALKDASGLVQGALSTARDITDRNRAEEALRESERHNRFLADLLERSDQPFGVGYPDGRLGIVNRAFEQLTGYSREELQTMDWAKVLTPSKWHDLERSKLEELRRTSKPVRYEKEYIRKDGTVVHIELLVHMLTDEHGQPKLYYSFLTDLTERKQAEEVLMESEARLRAILDATPFPVALVDVQDNNIDFWSRSALTLFGHTAPTATEWYQIAYPDPDYRREVIDRWKPFLEVARQSAQAVNTGLYRVTCHDGSARLCELYAAFVADRLVITFNDITERKQAEEMLHLLKSIVENSGEAISVTDPKGRFIFLNKAHERLFGRSLAEAQQFSCRSYYAPESAEILNARVIPALARGESWEGILNARDSSGRMFPLWEHADSIRDAGGYVLYEFGIMHDFSERQALEAQLQQAQKMESVGRLAGGVAHDFNNMLAVILGYASLALQEVDPAQPLHDDLMEIRKAAQRSADLTRQLLAFARKQTIAPMVLDLNETIAGTLNMLKRLIGEDVDLNWQPEEDLWPVKADPSQLDQIMANLCVNARDAITGVGKMTIETRNRTLDEDYCSTRIGLTPGEYVTLAVSDDGCGMDKETQSHIFEPFFTTKGIGKGTGLGLSTVYGAIKQNSGYIEVSSEPGKGTTFTVYLPRHVGKVEQLQQKGPADPSASGHETILLVEDEPVILKLTKRVLEKLGHTVLAASTPGDAIRLARESTGEIHLLMTDVVMPEMNGCELAEKLLAVQPGLKCLYMSGYTADVIALQGVLDEGVQFIHKPFGTDELSVAIRNVMEKT